ncbi:MAG: DUF2520 domain-containing protein [Ignavibacteria bacterium]|nr:DUF2520 domain-containing protein [Ignavibacteria bacterium]
MPEQKRRNVKRGRFRVAVIGGGQVGRVLGKLLVAGGHEVGCVISRTSASARSAGRFIGCRNTGTSLSLIPSDVNLLFLAVPHAAVEPVASDLARLDHIRFGTLGACHMSGMLSAEALAPLARRGARTFSFHPLQTFPRDFHPRKIIGSIRGIYYGVDGTAESLKIAGRLARTLGGSTVEIPPEMRRLYHAACVVASNHLTAMLFVLDEMFRIIRPDAGAGFLEVFRPIIDATLGNVERASPADALSGPVARGGVETVRGHLEAIRKFDQQVLEYFIAMTNETLRLAAVKGSVNEEQKEAMRSMLRTFEVPLKESM